MSKSNTVHQESSLAKKRSRPYGAYNRDAQSSRLTLLDASVFHFQAQSHNSPHKPCTVAKIEFWYVIRYSVIEEKVLKSQIESWICWNEYDKCHAKIIEFLLEKFTSSITNT